MHALRFVSHKETAKMQMNITPPSQLFPNRQQLATQEGEGYHILCAKYVTPGNCNACDWQGEREYDILPPHRAWSVFAPEAMNGNGMGLKQFPNDKIKLVSNVEIVFDIL